MLIVRTLLHGLAWLNGVAYDLALPRRGDMACQLLLVGAFMFVGGELDLPFDLCRTFRLEQRFNRTPPALRASALVKSTLDIAIGGLLRRSRKRRAPRNALTTRRQPGGSSRLTMSAMAVGHRDIGQAGAYAGAECAPRLPATLAQRPYRNANATILNAARRLDPCQERTKASAEKLAPDWLQHVLCGSGQQLPAHGD